ncbi:FAD/NAD(P)-binding protein [Corynebacterium callunae]|uniref:FAD/NAD(P)-binding protein n=1 Tax=Corynebacterium callunae TaxID=1721 RepID=UPI003981FFD2
MNAPIKVAIIGGGPRGLWAVEELLFQARTHAVAVDIDVWEPQELGIGAAYSPEQPPYWRLNVDASLIRTRSTTFNQWRGDAEDPFPSRAQVGEFFHAAFLELYKNLPPGCSLNHIKRRAETLEQVGEQWRIENTLYQEVLSATGHAQSWEGSLDTALKIYPRAELACIKAGQSVAIRGAALSFIDAVLELTEGRGGYFDATGYHPSGQEPAVIYPYSRSGQLMEVKPNPGVFTISPDLIATYSAKIKVARDLPEFQQAVAQCALALLDTPDKTAVQAILAGEIHEDPVAKLRFSLQVARGEVPPGAAWAVGQAWRSLYPAIVQRASYGGRASLAGFDQLAARLERVAFGPPPVNAHKILALFDAGILDATALSPAGKVPAVDVTVDAVLAPPTLNTPLKDQLVVHNRGQWLHPNGMVVGLKHLAVVGRESEDVVLGPDTLSRTLNNVIPRWAATVIKNSAAKTLENPRMRATVPLTARLEPWAIELLGNPQQCQEVLARFGSPANMLHSAPLLRNCAELVDAGADAGVETRIFFARKANKALTFVDAIRDAGHGVDVASVRELQQVLDRGVLGENIILSAAIKPDELLELALKNGVRISLDSVSELQRVGELAQRLQLSAYVAPRLAPDPTHLPATRFGEVLAVWTTQLAQWPAAVQLVGVHFHLHGYSATDRKTALKEAFLLVDSATAAGHRPRFVDIGGGVPMSYVDDEQQWENFQRAREQMNAGQRPPFSWKADPLAQTYPFHQKPIRGQWLSEILDGTAPEFIKRGLRLHVEPGRAVLDGCGLILVRVAFLKHRSDGVPLVGLEMNRTQCRTTSDDILLDPILMPQSAAKHTAGTEWGPGATGFLVGAYCIEDEVIIKREMVFPEGIKPGDIIAIPNTAGYFMHILESASHQIPLAKNVVWGETLSGDDIDIS